MSEKNENKYNFWKQWHFKTDKGRQWWEYKIPDELNGIIQTEKDWQKPEGKTYLDKLSAAFSFNKKSNPNSGDKVYRLLSSQNETTKTEKNLNSENNLAESAKTSALKGFSFYEILQTNSGNWPGDYGGPLFLLPGMIIVSYITESPFELPISTLMKQYMINHQNEDGGWGLHIEDSSTMFGTVMQYVSLRILGLNADDEIMAKASKWIKKNGEAKSIPPWGKFYLSILGLYEWEGNDSLFPEMWILPRWLPFHPGRYWCHARMVYLPMTYCYGHKMKIVGNSFIDSLKKEIYNEDYEKINWKNTRGLCAEKDEYKPLSPLYKLFISVANLYERFHIKIFRKKALRFILEYVEAEDRDTNYISIGPVNQVINSLCIWHQYGKDSVQFKSHRERWKDYLWLAEDGMKMNGYNGSQLWDTAFAGQALAENRLVDNFPEMSKKLYNYLDISQIKRNPNKHKRYFRTLSIGGWPFSTEEHGWPITDCTSEGMKTMIAFAKSKTIQSAVDNLPDANRYKGAVDFLLSTQNKDGGWASYEEARAPAWLEKLNPSRIFTNIMLEYSYVECTSAAVQGLIKFNEEFPDYLPEKITPAIKHGSKFIQNKQRIDGSWYGSWAVCFTYGTWFGIEGLVAAGEKFYQKDGSCSSSIKRACEFLVSKQKPDGSWGESYRSCVEKKYVVHETGQVVNTAWALLGLMAANFPDKKAIEKGIEFLLKMQNENGDWPQQGISGVFNGNCMITYSAYRNIFPLWALGRYVNYCSKTN